MFNSNSVRSQINSKIQITPSRSRLRISSHGFFLPVVDLSMNSGGMVLCLEPVRWIHNAIAPLIADGWAYCCDWMRERLLDHNVSHRKISAWVPKIGRSEALSEWFRRVAVLSSRTFATSSLCRFACAISETCHNMPMFSRKKRPRFCVWATWFWVD